MPPDHGQASGRFLLGLGIGHAEAVKEYKKPYDKIIEYLGRLDEHLDAGADHVCVHALGDDPLAAYRAVAARLLFLIVSPRPPARPEFPPEQGMLRAAVL